MATEQGSKRPQPIELRALLLRPEQLNDSLSWRRKKFAQLSDANPLHAAALGEISNEIEVLSQRARVLHADISATSIKAAQDRLGSVHRQIARLEPNVPGRDFEKKGLSIREEILTARIQELRKAGPFGKPTTPPVPEGTRKTPEPKRPSPKAGGSSAKISSPTEGRKSPNWPPRTTPPLRLAQPPVVDHTPPKLAKTPVIRRHPDVAVIPARGLPKRTETTATQPEPHRVAAPAAPIQTTPHERVLMRHPQRHAETAVQKPNVVDVINAGLARETGREAHFNLTPQELSSYFESIPIKTKVKKGPISVPVHGNFHDVDIRIRGKQVILHGEASAALSTSSFNAVLRIEGGRLVIVSKDVKLGTSHKFASGKINDTLDNVDGELRHAINARVDQRWSVAGYELIDDKIGVNFERKRTR